MTYIKGEISVTRSIELEGTKEINVELFLIMVRWGKQMSRDVNLKKFLILFEFFRGIHFSIMGKSAPH